jgi:glucan phosphoethanolaminetransferase (alkaline phosphatase superfamily)
MLLVGMENVLFYNFIYKTVYFYEKSGLAIAGFYLFTSLLGSLFIAMTLFIKNRVLFLSFISFELLSYLIVKIYKDINGYGFGLTELNVAYSEMGKFTVDVWSSYSTYFYHNLLLFLLPIMVVVYLFRKFLKRAKGYYFPLSLLSFLLFLTLSTSYMIVRKTTNETSPSPMPVKMVNTLTYFILNRPYYGDRKRVEKSPIKESKYNNIIWIIDESVGGAYLSINGYEKETTPYLDSIADDYLNLGLASSGANCSAISNILLMSGIPSEALPDTEFNALKKASIFQYAKRAGYRTHYLSGQSKDNVLQNFMTTFDLEDIDDFSQPTGVYQQGEIPERRIIEKSVQALASHKKNFIYIVKEGSHFHWEHSYPASHKVFKPTLLASESLSFNKREEALNSYANSIRYGVDLFFKEFFAQTGVLEREDTLIIYTSDHGQSILESEHLAVTHCSATNPPVSQGVVPLLIFRNREDRLFKKVFFSKDIYSHYEIFPTTLQLMGYETHGETFFTKKEGGEAFCSGDLFGRATFMKTAIQP